MKTSTSVLLNLEILEVAISGCRDYSITQVLMPNLNNAVLVLRLFHQYIWSYPPSCTELCSFIANCKTLALWVKHSHQAAASLSLVILSLTDSGYNPKFNLNVLLDPLLLFTGHLTQICTWPVVTSKAIHAPQPYQLSPAVWEELHRGLCLFFWHVAVLNVLWCSLQLKPLIQR